MSLRPRFRALRVVIIIAVLICVTLLAWVLVARPFARAQVQPITLATGTPAQLVTPARAAASRVLLVMPHDTRLSDEELLAFAEHGNTRLVQFELSEKRDCNLALAQVNAALARLEGSPDLVAGIGMVERRPTAGWLGRTIPRRARLPSPWTSPIPFATSPSLKKRPTAT